MAESLAMNPLLEKLLQYDVERFAELLGFAGTPTELRDADAAALLNLAERYSRDPGDEARNRCLLICGLLWEHRREHWRAMPGFIVHLLSRLGLGPSMPMVDEEYDSDTGELLPLGSIALEAAVTARCLEKEVEVAGSRRILLSEFQHDVWRAIDRHPRLGISAPTSAGKSHVLVHKVLDILWRRPGAAIFVVPTLSLIQQVSRDVRKTATRLEIRNLEVLQTYTPKLSVGFDRLVYVLTQERALAALGQPEAFVGARIVVIDEVQNVERVANEDDDRSRTLFDVIQEIEATRQAERIVISGPRLENIHQLSRQLFGPSAESVTADLPPVVNLTYTFSRKGKQPFLKQYSAVSDSPCVVTLDSDQVPKAVFGGRQYRDPIQDFIATVVERVTTGHGTLIFSPTSRQATKTALELAERIELERSDRIPSLQEYISESVHPNYGLMRSLDSGIAFHHGKMPQHIRVAVEQAFSDLDVSAIACTTTLMQGVNLPAKNLIARNPHLYIQRADGSVSLTAYEFANLRGRAGRLLKDFVGRAIILDEGSFTKQEIEFDFPGKEVSAGYGERFRENRSDIMKQLLEGDGPSIEQRESDLVVYIRQAVLKHGVEALDRLQRVGITLSDHEYSETRRQMESLQVPREICIRLPYWDPTVLDELYRLQMNDRITSLPRSPFTTGFVDRILRVLGDLRSAVPFYFTKYLGIDAGGMLQSVAISAQRWSAEEPLHDIISWGSHPDALSWEAIDDRIDRVNKRVVHDLPKLLRPLALMQGEENPLLGFIEMGAYRPETRRLIELGLPRETALRLAARIGTVTAPYSDFIDDRQLISRAYQLIGQLNGWEQRQLQDTFALNT